MEKEFILLRIIEQEKYIRNILEVYRPEDRKTELLDSAYKIKDYLKSQLKYIYGI